MLKRSYDIDFQNIKDQIQTKIDSSALKRYWIRNFLRPLKVSRDQWQYMKIEGRAKPSTLEKLYDAWIAFPKHTVEVIELYKKIKQVMSNQESK